MFNINNFKIVVNKKKLFVYIIALACFCSNISQLPVFVSSGMTQKLNMPIWLLFLIVIIFKKRIRLLRDSFKMFLLLLSALVFITISSILTGYSYFNSSLLFGLMLSCFIYYLGSCVGDIINDNDLKLISLSYVLSASIVAFDIYREFFSVGFDIMSRQYAYASKNSISQIIFTSVVIMMFVNFKNIRTFNFLKWAVILFEVVLLMFLKSRATLIGFGFCIVYIILGKDFNKRIKFVLSITVLLLALLLAFNESLLDMLLNSIIFAGRDVTNLDSLTSGRVSILSEFPELIKGHWITGIGSLYFECFPLSCILQFGIFAGLIIMTIAYSPLLIVPKLDKSNPYISIYIIVCIGYILNSFFEGLAPIGPGVKCYFMWLLYGILASHKTRNEKK